MASRRVARLMHLSPDSIVKNPDNPRLIFRPDELDELMESIRSLGIQVPITVYYESKKGKYVIMDGERRWRCSVKLNLKTVPALVHPKPSRLENIIQMFHIHHVRLALDLLPTAYKLQDVEQLLKKEGKTVTISDLASLTGLPTSRVRQARILLGFPERYIDTLLEELKKPQGEQELSEDLFLEMAKALNSIDKHVPEALRGLGREGAIDSFIGKYKSGMIDNIVKFRDVSRIARGERSGVDRKRIVGSLRKLLTDPTVRIETVYGESIALAETKRAILRQVRSLTKQLAAFDGVDHDPELKRALDELRRILEKVLG